jgi:hypothetical protein
MFTFNKTPLRALCTVTFKCQGITRAYMVRKPSDARKLAIKDRVIMKKVPFDMTIKAPKGRLLNGRELIVLKNIVI